MGKKQALFRGCKICFQSEDSMFTERPGLPMKPPQDHDFGRRIFWHPARCFDSWKLVLGAKTYRKGLLERAVSFLVRFGLSFSFWAYTIKRGVCGEGLIVSNWPQINPHKQTPFYKNATPKTHAKHCSLCEKFSLNAQHGETLLVPSIRRYKS